MLLLMQCSVQLPGMPGVLRRAVLSAQLLSVPDDGADGGCLPLLLGDLVHWGSLVRDPDDAVVQCTLGLATPEAREASRERLVRFV